MLDLIGRKLLFELDVDGFQTNSSLAKKLKISKQVVGYRIKHLYEKGILRKIYPFLALEELGFVGQKVYFQMKNLSEEAENKITSYFKNHENVVWFGLYDGRFDFVVSLFTLGKSEFSEIFEKIQQDLSEYIIDFSIASYTGIVALKKNYLLSKKITSSEKFSLVSSTNKRYSIDLLDKKILKFLCEDGRIHSLQIAEKLNVKADTVIRRVKKLKKDGIIQGSRAMIDKEKLNIFETKILLQTRNLNQKLNGKLVAFSKQQKNVVAYITCIGPWNIEFDIEVMNYKEIHKLIQEIKSMLGEKVVRLEILNLYDEYKYDFYPFAIK